MWRNKIVETLKDPNNDLALKTSGKLMNLNLETSQLKVEFSERLVLLIRESR